MNAQIDTGSAFDAWFDGERANGLVDVKLAISSQRGASAQAVQDEILNIEILAKNGRVKDLPVANTFLTEDLERMIRSVSIA